MSLVRSILVFGWIALMAAYGFRQAIYSALTHNNTQYSKDLSYFFANDDTSYLFFQSSAKENVLKTAQQEPFLKWIIINAQYIITTFIRTDSTFLIDFEANQTVYISKIIFPFHTFW